MTEQNPMISELNILSRDTKEKLAHENIYTSLQLLFTPNNVLEKYFGNKELVNILIAVQSQIGGVYRILNKKMFGEVANITTSSTLLDSKLEDGVHSRQITEICSEQRFPRNQLCYNIMLKFLQEYRDGVVLYNDSNGMFRPERLNQLGHFYGLESKDILERISVFRPYTVPQQIEIFKIYETSFKKFKNKFLVVDGLCDSFKLLARKKNIIFNRLKALENFIMRLNYLAANDNIIVIFLNNMVQRFHDNSMIPEHEDIIGPFIRTKILVHRLEDMIWEAKVIIGDRIEAVPFSLTEYGAGDNV
jgi:RecA/RadA recombinase